MGDVGFYGAVWGMWGFYGAVWGMWGGPGGPTDLIHRFVAGRVGVGVEFHLRWDGLGGGEGGHSVSIATPPPPRGDHGASGGFWGGCGATHVARDEAGHGADLCEQPHLGGDDSITQGAPPIATASHNNTAHSNGIP